MEWEREAKIFLKNEQCSFYLGQKLLMKTIAERKTKKKEELRALILDGAKKLFVKKGIEATTIRNIADAVDYSIGTVYVYFKDKNAILHALHTQGFVQLGSDFKVLYNVADPM